MKFSCIVADPPYHFSDRLLQSATKRGAESQYAVMTDQDIINLDIKHICEDDAILALWVPGSKLDIGLACAENWGFKITQTWIWVKTKQSPLGELKKNISKIIKEEKKNVAAGFNVTELIYNVIDGFGLNDVLNFFMGHCFRQTHELCLIGVRGKYTRLLENRSQRSVYVGPALEKHSQKPEELQDRLDIMLGSVPKIEIFARRDRPGWTCVGLQCPSTMDEDIRDSIKKLSVL